MGKVDLQCAEMSPRWQHNPNRQNKQKPSLLPSWQKGEWSGPLPLQLGRHRAVSPEGWDPKFQGKEKTLRKKDSQSRKEALWVTLWIRVEPKKENQRGHPGIPAAKNGNGDVIDLVEWDTPGRGRFFLG